MTETPNTNEPVEPPAQTGGGTKTQPDPGPSDPPEGNTITSDI